MTATRYASLGKEVLQDGQHFADCISTESAERVARALNLPEWLDAEAGRLGNDRELARGLRCAADHVRMEA